MQWITLSLAVVAIWLSLRRLWMLDWRKHRVRLVLAYILMACTAVVAASGACQEQGDYWTLAAVVLVAACLVATLRDWTVGVPEWAAKDRSGR